MNMKETPCLEDNDCQGIVVDDDSASVDTFTENLEDEGICVIGKGYNGKEAVELYKKLKPKFVVLDMSMPEYDGAYAIKKIKDEDSTAKIIIVTAYTNYKFDKNDVTAVFPKPYNMDKIISLIQDICA